jgi:hypothetical protein
MHNLADLSPKYKFRFLDAIEKSRKVLSSNQESILSLEMEN